MYKKDMQCFYIILIKDWVDNMESSRNISCSIVYSWILKIHSFYIEHMVVKETCFFSPLFIHSFIHCFIQQVKNTCVPWVSANLSLFVCDATVAQLETELDFEKHITAAAGMASFLYY